MIADRGDDAEHQHLRYIKQLNAALEARPEGMVVTTHSCRGNFQSYWAAEGGYDFVAEALFNELNVDGFFLEYDDARSGDFKPLRFVPEGKIVVLGLVTTKRPELENKDDLKRRIDEADRVRAARGIDWPVSAVRIFVDRGGEPSTVSRTKLPNCGSSWKLRLRCGVEWRPSVVGGSGRRTSRRTGCQ